MTTVELLVKCTEDIERLEERVISIEKFSFELYSKYLKLENFVNNISMVIQKQSIEEIGVGISGEKDIKELIKRVRS